MSKVQKGWPARIYEKVGRDYVEAINTTIRCYEGITEADEMVRSLEA